MDAKEYHRVYNRERYRRLRAEYITKLGGQCIDCGSVENLEFDHDDASIKSFDIGKLLNYSKAVREMELKKCVLRCSSCHKKKSVRAGDVWTVEHGGGVSGKRNCPCIPCKQKKTEYMRNYKHLRRRRVRVLHAARRCIMRHRGHEEKYWRKQFKARKWEARKEERQRAREEKRILKAAKRKNPKRFR